MTKNLPSFLTELLAAPPRAGEGVHPWLYRVARQLHAHFRPQEVFSLLKERVQNCGRHVSDSEIWDSVKNSLPCAWQPRFTGAPIQSTSKWPTVNQEQRAAIIRDGGGLADLWEASRVRLEDNERHAEEIIDRLFPGNPLLCCGKSNSVFDTKAREDWRGELSTLALMVPSPMSAIDGVTKDGKPSKHTLSNTGTRRFLVVEFDPSKWCDLSSAVQSQYGDESKYAAAMQDEHAALLLHLGTFAPLVCAVHSGGKSLHGWFYVHGQPDVKVEKFFRYAVSLGADRATWTRSQFVRMPDGTRDNGNPQTVFFLNFKPMEARR